MQRRSGHARLLISCVMVWAALAVAVAVHARLHAQTVRGHAPQALALTPGAAIDASPIVASASRQVYRLLIETDGALKTGTGFLVSGSRIVATNNHVVEQGKRFALGLLDERGGIRRVRLELLAVFPQKDLALLQAAESLPGQALPLATGYPEPASDLYAIGFPAAADLAFDIASLTSDGNFFLPSVLKGNVSRIMTGVWLTYPLQHQTPISAGYSGGPLVDNRGVVVGVSSAVNKQASGIAYAVTAPDLARLLGACALPLHAVGLADSPAPEAGPAKDEPAQDRPDAADPFLLKHAYQLLQRGDIARARSMFEYLVRKSGDRNAYKGLARTYDPAVLSRLKVLGDLADPGKARRLYQMADEAGSAAPDMPARAPTADEAGGKPARGAEAPSLSPSSHCSESLCMMLETAEGPPHVLCRRDRSPIAAK